MNESGPLIEHKTTNAMNNMLPSIRTAHEEAVKLEEKEEKE